MSTPPASLLLSRRDLDFLLYDWLDAESLGHPDALRGALPRHLRRRTRSRGRSGHRTVRPAQQAQRRRRAHLRRPARPHDPRGEERPRRPRPHRPARRHHGRGTRRHPAAARRVHRVLRLLPGRERRNLGLPLPDHRQREPAARARLPGTDRHLCAPDAGRPVPRHDVPVRTAGRLLAGRHHHAGPCRRTTGPTASPATRCGSPAGDHELGRQHRPPGPRQDPGRPGGDEGHLAVHRAQVPGPRRRHDRRTQRRRAGRPQPQDGLPRHHQHPAQLRRGRAHPRRPAGRRRIPRRRSRTAASPTCST